MSLDLGAVHKLPGDYPALIALAAEIFWVANEDLVSSVRIPVLAPVEA